MRLRRNERCPIHQSLFCCGRDPIRKERKATIVIRMGVQRVEDPHHPRGYRELRSPAEMRKLLNRKIVEQDRKCATCHEEFTDYSDVAPDHTGIRKEWAERGQMTIQIISRQRISGAMKKKDQPEWMIESCACAFAQRRKGKRDRLTAHKPSSLDSHRETDTVVRIVC